MTEYHLWKNIEADLVSLEQHRCIQILLLLHVHGELNREVFVVPPRNTGAAKRKKYKTEKYENTKYRNSPYFKAAKLCDSLPPFIVESGTITELKRHLKGHYSLFDDNYFVT